METPYPCSISYKLYHSRKKPNLLYFDLNNYNFYFLIVQKSAARDSRY